MSEGKHDVKTHAKAEEAPKKKRRSPLKILLALILLLAAAVAGSVYYIYKTAEDSLELKFKEDKPAVESRRKDHNLYGLTAYTQRSVHTVKGVHAQLYGHRYSRSSDALER